MKTKTKNNACAKIGVFLLIAITLLTTAQAMSLEDLLKSYSFDYQGTVEVTNVQDSMLDTNADTINDTLIIELTTNSTLNKEIFVDLENENNAITTNLTTTNQTVQIAINTNRLSKERYNYSIRIYQNDVLEYRKDTFETNQYLIYDEGYTIVSVTDSNQNNDAIDIQFTINSTVSGNYLVSTVLEYDSGMITNTTQKTLSSGVNTVTITFDDETIKRTHHNGLFTIKTVTIGEKRIPVNQTTSSYNFEDFADTSYIKNITDHFIDTDSSTLYDFLEINTTINVKNANTYTIQAELFDQEENNVATIEKQETLSTGYQTITARIAGEEIYDQGRELPYIVKNIKLIENTQIIDTLQEQSTNITSIQAFERPDQPDLIVTTFYNYSTMELVTTVTNNGTVDAFDVFTDIFDNESYSLQYYISKLDAFDFVKYTEQIDETKNVYAAIVDFENMVDENNETNNVVSGFRLNYPPTDITLTNPKPGYFYDEVIPIEWSAATDFEGQPVTYEIQYSVDSGNTWLQLANGIEGTSYQWNVTTLSANPSLLQNIIHYWSMDNSTINSNTLSDLVGSTTGTIKGSTTTTAGLIGEAFDFNGGTHNCVIFNDPLPDQQSASLSIWAKSTSSTNLVSGNVERVFGTSRQSAFEHRMTFLGDGNGGVQADIRGSGGNPSIKLKPEIDYYDGNWHNYVFIWDNENSTLYLYVDNVLVNQSTETLIGSFTTTDTWAIGDQTQSGASSCLGNSFEGFIDETGLWNKVLSSQEISTLYNNGNGITYPFETGDVESGSEFRIRVRANDGFNNGNWIEITDNFNIGLKPYTINNLELLDNSNTDAVFMFDITSLSKVQLTGINWSLDTGQYVINSTLSIEMDPLSITKIIAHHNYTATGTYDITAIATSPIYQTEETIEVTI